MGQKNKLEFSSIQITKSLNEAVTGAAELTEQNVEDFVHKSLATVTWQTLQNKSEIVQLRGESVNEDLELLKHHWKMKRKGSSVFLRSCGNSHQLRIMSNAQAEFEKWLKDKDETDSHPYDAFESLLKNIQHEQRWNIVKYERSDELRREGVSFEECEGLLSVESNKYREKHGYLESEIPFDPSFGIQASLPIPELLSEFKDLKRVIDDGGISIKDIALIVMFWKLIKTQIIGFIGKRRFKRISTIFKKRLRKYIDSKINKLDT